ncbi:hypothetical protein M885DRAFT_549992 [Pelagophyceae sp. CCMP2097]|nr:hypothetical protein M885DRAFT_549992 [Pelagophyceae sp. CCMP2097]
MMHPGYPLPLRIFLDPARAAGTATFAAAAPRKRKIDNVAPDLLDDAILEDRLLRSRERNREHARRTRLRKKEQVSTLQARCAELQGEASHLGKVLQECATAAALLGLAQRPQPGDFACAPTSPQLLRDAAALAVDDGEGDNDAPWASRWAWRGGGDDGAPDDAASASSAGARASKAEDGGDVPEDVATVSEDGSTSDGSGGGAGGVGGTARKRGAGAAARRHALTPQESELARRERNRLHAKQTRDRKKVYVARLERAVAGLEVENRRVRDLLAHRIVGQRLDAWHV